LGEIRIRLNVPQDGHLDRRALAFTLFKALRIPAFQQRHG
jgi:hypothetical protein